MAIGSASHPWRGDGEGRALVSLPFWNGSGLVMVAVVSVVQWGIEGLGS